uniref:hypothetical protein n=1 Tax=Shewanella baltica TaxID=62322 RepID=UPI004048E97B
MHIYLDQNIWIDLAKIHHGKDKRPESIRLLNLIQKKIESDDIVLPLSRVHYIETSTIANAGRRERLGRVMFDYSKGITLAPYKSILVYELDCALSKIFNHVKPRSFKLFGNGIKHAYGDALEFTYPAMMSPNWIDRSALTGEEICGHRFGGFHKTEHNKKFQEHLRNVSAMRKTVPRKDWNNTLYAIALSDIVEPLSEVLDYWRIQFDDFIGLGAEVISSFIDNMPSRKLEVHMHRQVLNNSNYNPKPTDLEDWGGIALASQYCDVIIGEKHLYDMLLRNNFKTKAEIFRRLSDLEPLLEKFI